MSRSTTNQWKLGAFVMAGVALGIVALLWLGSARFNREITQRRAYFKESVNGLEVGSPVKLRGVTIGSVASIGFAPDGRAVEVVLDGYVEKMRRLGLDDTAQIHTNGGDTPGLYAQLASSGITGNKYILVDYFEPDREMPALNSFDFPLGDDVLMTIPSSLESIEQLFLHAAETLPATLDDLRGMAAKTREMIEQLDIAPTLASIEQLTDSLSKRREQLGTMLDDLSSVAATLDEQLGAARLADTTASLRGAGDAVTGVAAGTEEMTREARRVLDSLDASSRELSETLRAVRMLAELLERDPGALLRGREPAAPAPRSP